MQRKEGSYFRMFEILLAVLLLEISSQPVTCGSIIHYLPGFEGPLPMHLETGYVGVGEAEDGQIFYYFFKSERNPKEDPLLLWISGGPACSSLSGLMFETGPLAFKKVEYTGGVPKLELRQQSWTKVCSIIYVDLPVDTGFSYSKSSDPHPCDSGLVTHAYEFLRKWLVEHPEYLSNEVYISAGSYSGITIPAIVEEISNGNEEGIQPWINLQGYLLGNPVTTLKEYKFKAPFAHGMGLISDEMNEMVKENCPKYMDAEHYSQSCARALVPLNNILSEVDYFNILEPKCKSEFEVHRGRRSLYEEFDELLDPRITLPPLSCRNYAYFLSYYWTNKDEVRLALHVQKGSRGRWKRCNITPYKKEIPGSFEYHVNLSKKGFRSLIYSGDHDPIIPFMATEAWIQALNYSIVDDWRSWLVNGQVAGYTRTYSNKMTFATVKGAGHTAAEYKPEECLAMLYRWISRKPL